MKKTSKSILLILIGLTLCSVNAQADKNASSGLATENEKQPEIVVENKSDYSKKFIEGLKEIPYKKFALKDNLLIIDDTDTTYFSETPKIGKRFVLAGEKEGLKITVTVKRINYTTVDYTIEMFSSGELKHSQVGQADIASAFFLGDESDESDKSGVSYFVTEFSELRENDCYTYIRLGYEEETGPYLLGKLVKNCNGDIHEIALDDFPTLIEKNKS